MAERKKSNDVGRDAPGSEIAKEQRIPGMSSGPQDGREAEDTPKQPPQTSNRRAREHEHEPTVRKGYEAARNPERQGDGDPGPEQINERSTVQGSAGRSHGGAAGEQDVTEQAHSGEPAGGHTPVERSGS